MRSAIWGVLSGLVVNGLAWMAQDGEISWGLFFVLAGIPPAISFKLGVVDET